MAEGEVQLLVVLVLRFRLEDLAVEELIFRALQEP
jgi:hypothetical protein